MATAQIPIPSPDIAGAADRVGTYAWLSSRLFEVTGSWSAGDDPAAFSSVSSRFAWQANQWFDRLPMLAEVDRIVLVRSPGPSATRRLEKLAALASDQERRRELVALVVDLDAIYQAHEAAAAPVRDGPVIRTLRRVRADLDDLLNELGFEPGTTPAPRTERSDLLS